MLHVVAAARPHHPPSPSPSPFRSPLPPPAPTTRPLVVVGRGPGAARLLRDVDRQLYEVRHHSFLPRAAAAAADVLSEKPPLSSSLQSGFVGVWDGRGAAAIEVVEGAGVDRYLRVLGRRDAFAIGGGDVDAAVATAQAAHVARLLNLPGLVVGVGGDLAAPPRAALRLRPTRHHRLSGWEWDALMALGGARLRVQLSEAELPVLLGLADGLHEVRATWDGGA